MSSSEISGLGRKVLKVAGIISACLLGLILILTILLLTALEPYAERFLKKQVAEQTNGLYQLDFEDIYINLLSTTVTLDKVKLSADSAVHLQQRKAGEASPMLVYLETEEFTVSSINILDLLLRKQLSIGTVFMDSPQIKLFKDNKVEKGQQNSKESKGKGGMGGLVKSIDIGEIDIPSASVYQYVWGASDTPVHAVPHLSLRILEMELGPLDADDYAEMFDAEDIQLELRDYAYHVPDNVYHIAFRLFSYASKAGKLQLEDLKVTPNHEANVALNTQDAKRMLFEVLVPQFRLEGFNVVEAYQNKQIQMDGLTLQNAALEVLENPEVPADTASMDPKQLYAKVSEFLKSISLDEVNLSGISVAYRTKYDQIVTVQSLDKLDVKLREVQIDSATLFSPRENLPVQDFFVAAENYRFSHPTSPYTYSFGLLELSSQEKYLYINSAIVRADLNKNDRLKATGKALAVLYDFKSPGIRIDNLDLLQAFKTSILDIGNIELARPALAMVHAQQVPEPDVTVQELVQSTYEQVSNFVKELKVGQLHFQNAYFTEKLKKGSFVFSQELGDASLSLTGIHIDSLFIYEQEPRLPLDNIVLAGRNYKYLIPGNAQTLSLGQFRYSTKNKTFTARSIDLNYDLQQNNRLKKSDDAQRSLYDFSAPMLRIEGLDVIKAMNSGRLAVNQITFSQPNVGVLMNRGVTTSSSEGNKQEQLKNALFRFFNPITFNAVHLEDGTFTYRENRDEIIRTQRLDHLSSTITGLYLSPKTFTNLDDAIPINEMLLTASNYTYQSPDSVYTVTLDSMRYSSREQELLARLFNITSDREAHERLKEQNFDAASRNLFDVSAREFKISGLDLIHSYRTGRFVMAEVLLTRPEVAILQDQRVVERRSEDGAAGEGTSGEQKDTESKNQVSEQLDEIVDVFRVERLRLEDGDFVMNILEDTVQKSQSLGHVSVVLDELRLASLDASDPLEMFKVDDLGILVRDYEFLTADSLYEFSIAKLRTSLSSQTLVIDSLELEPLFETDEYQDKLEYAEDRIELTLPKIEMQGLKLYALFNNQEIIASKISLLEPELNMYRDRRVDEDPNRRPPTLQSMLRNVKYFVQIDTIAVGGGEIIYSEIAADGVEPGVLTLDDTKLLFTNITNDTLQLREKSIVTVVGSSSFMGKSLLKANFEFHMDHPEDLYTYEGTLEPMKFEAFNPLFEKIMFFRMESGSINEAKFNVRATEHISEGQVHLLYDDLKMQMIDKNDPGNPGFFLNAGSWLINNLVVKDNNPSKLGNYREGNIKVERDYTKSVFNHMSSAMTSGITSSVMPKWIEKIVDALIGLP
ncbi:hypothetical protein [Pontibacter harenae]|uniref:hypothetical protein n=1 Tax=Pontibacter harenae TaxID=2894083 RepID=UPI001E420EA3|nr:hypothetical protein [Pontibacter harenae]MCC9167705.1 hypothetical protein [Pontibacter harenae]